MSTSTRPRATPNPLRVLSLLSAKVAELKSLAFKGQGKRCRRRTSLSRNLPHPLGFWFHPKAPTQSETTSESGTIDSDMAVKSVPSVSNVFGSVRRLPRKAGRFVCVGDAGHSPVEITFPAFASASSDSSRSSASGTASHSTVSSQVSVVATERLVHAPAAYRPGPIITVEKLQRALSCSDVEFQTAYDPTSVVSTPGPELKSPKPQAAKGLSIQVVSSLSISISDNR